MTLKPALTLIELMLVVSIISIISAAGFYLSSNFRTRQALTSSSDEVISNLRRAHVFSRESKDDMDWGIRRKSDTVYALVSRDISSSAEVLLYSLHAPITFAPGNFEIWFDQGTGETANPITISMQSPKGEIRQIGITKSGGIERL